MKTCTISSHSAPASTFPTTKNSRSTCKLHFCFLIRSFFRITFLHPALEGVSCLRFHFLAWYPDSVRKLETLNKPYCEMDPPGDHCLAAVWVYLLILDSPISSQLGAGQGLQEPHVWTLTAEPVVSKEGTWNANLSHWSQKDAGIVLSNLLVQDFMTQPCW